MISSQGMREAEQEASLRGIDLIGLAHRVGDRLAKLIALEFSWIGLAVVYLGKGVNAVDALIAARKLQQMGWEIRLRCAFPLAEMHPEILELMADMPLPVERFPLVEGDFALLIDGLVGIGHRKGLGNAIANLTKEINYIRSYRQGITVAVDVPTGVHPDTGEVEEHAVCADWTFCIGACKLGLVEDNATSLVGRLVEIPLPELQLPESRLQLIQSRNLRHLLKAREFDWHKGQAGRVAIIAGSPGMYGAAVLCAKSALATGAGLVTCYTMRDNFEMLIGTLPPEVMVREVQDFIEVAACRFDALVIGPGLGELPTLVQAGLWKLIQNTKAPIVLDADILNLVSSRGGRSQIPSNAIITPHPGEMRNLFRSFDHESRMEKMQQALDVCSCTVVFKGSRTLVGKVKRRIRLNSAGHSGMATAGQGDALSGVIGGLCAQGVDGFDAACLGVWLCGRASELAVKGRAPRSLVTSETIEKIGEALLDLARGAL